jgi:hypothetical protein
MTALKRMPQDEFAQLCTRAFVQHIREGERPRFERKVMKTLQLAIMPKEVREGGGVCMYVGVGKYDMIYV